MAVTCRFSTPVGPMTITATARGVVRVLLPGEAKSKRLHGLLAESGAAATAARAHADRARREIVEYLAGRRRTFTAPVDLAGAPEFHVKVYRALRGIPSGRTMTYGQLAARVGSPRAARAVGQAMAANPVPILVACHRVVGAGGLGGYGGGLALKRRLLALESATA